MRTLYHFGRYLILLGGFFKSPERFAVYWRLFLAECNFIGVGSVLIVSLISVFIGAVMTVQTAYQLETPLLPKSLIGTTVANSALLELAPTVTSLVLAGKVGSAIASQLGTMRVTEQIDALEVMGVNSGTYLILPKIMASVVMFPLLIFLAAFLEIGGGLVAGELTGECSSRDFIAGAQEFFLPFYVTFMTIKALFFGFIISSIASYQGYFAEGGAHEVGQASTRAVVFSCIIVLLMDYVLAELLI